MLRDQCCDGNRIIHLVFICKDQRLAIAQHIVSDHGGTIQVESKVGEGTVFTIKLPACGCEKEAVEQAIES